MRIKDLSVRQIFDSRGEPTIEVGVRTTRGWFYASVPSGKSRGSNEAAVLPPKKARATLLKIRRKLLRNFNSPKSFDDYLIVLDGTKNKSVLGGNLMVGLSMAFARALAAERKLSLSQSLNKDYFDKRDLGRKPRIFSNLINGGLHAKNNLDIQEYLVVVEPRGSIQTAVEDLAQLYKTLGDYLSRKTSGIAPIGDEGGYAPDFEDNFKPLLVLNLLIQKLRLKNFYLGIDAAASDFFKKGTYQFAHQNFGRQGGKDIGTDALLKTYLYYFKILPRLLSIEDPFHERDVYGFKNLMAKARKMDKWVVSDDLTVTNPVLIEEAAESGLINAVIIKPNQIGTVSEACEAVKTARSHKFKIIVSHRSGETEDNFIIHLAKACGADGLKIGAPARERISKFNELLRLYA